jgi:hypothetical protein
VNAKQSWERLGSLKEKSAAIIHFTTPELRRKYFWNRLTALPSNVSKNALAKSTGVNIVYIPVIPLPAPAAIERSISLRAQINCLSPNYQPTA